MAVESPKRLMRFVGDGQTTIYPVPFRYLDPSHLYVKKANLSTSVITQLSLTTHFTLSGDGNAGNGLLTFVTAPTAFERVVVYRSTPIVQNSSLYDNQNETAQSLSDALDRLTMIAQEQSEEIGRAILTDITDVTPPPDISESAVATDLFLAKITGAPTGTEHPFEEVRPDTSGTGNVTFGGRTGNLELANATATTLTNTNLFVVRMNDANGNVRYRGWLASE